MFTDDEIDAAIQRYLLGAVSVPKTKTGSRETTQAKQQVYDLIATALLLRPESFYYVMWLASNRLGASARELQSALQEVMEAAPNVSGSSARVESVTELVNADAALVNLTAAFNARTTGVNTSVGPAVERFRASVEKFVTDELNKNVVRDGEVVETPEELRAAVSAVRTSILEDEAALRASILALQGAEENYGAARLPASNFRDLTSRIQTRLKDLQIAMAETTAPRDSRAAMLDLLVMRMLMQRAATFRGPSLILAPRQGDSTTATMIGGSGGEAELLGTVSGPWNQHTTDALQLEVSGDVVNVYPPVSSYAELRSAVFSPYVAPPNTQAATLVVNGVTNTTAMSTGWTTGALAAAALDAAFASLTVTWDATTSQLVFTAPVLVDQSTIEATASADFLAWAFLGVPRAVVSSPGAVEGVLTAVAGAHANLRAEAPRTTLARFVGVTEAAGVISAAVRTAADASSVGTSTILFDANVEALGVKAGMVIRFTGLAQTRTITSVDRGAVEIDSPVSAGSGLAYYIAHDLSDVPVGARARLSSVTTRSNNGYYRVTAVGVGKVTVTPQPSSGDAVNVDLFTQFLRIICTEQDTSSELEAVASTGATTYGITTGVVQPALLDSFSIVTGDLLQRGISPSDWASLEAPSGASYGVRVTEVDTKYFRVAEPLPYEAGNWAYQILSSEAIAFSTFLEALAAFDAAAPSTEQLALVLRRIAMGARESSSLTSVLEQYDDALTALRAACDAFVVPRDASIDAAIRVMVEHGFDRALDLFLEPSFQEFFTMTDDAVSYKTWIIRRTADVTRQVAAVSNDSSLESRYRVLSSTPAETFDPRARRDKENP